MTERKKDKTIQLYRAKERVNSKKEKKIEDREREMERRGETNFL